ncbi:MAG: molybdopterin-dependent oxidoreductase [Alphaproteobacteria bacterium]|nr:molybdopterin-dependent oxidoreductase [Alphaproteobacteria bacterium]
MADGTPELPAPVEGTSGVASLVPFGVGSAGPSPLREGLAALSANADQLGWAWRVLRHGVCDGCALGSAGLSDDVLPGVHLCRRRLRELRRHTGPALTPSDLTRLPSLRARDTADLRALGRIPFPFVHRPGDGGLVRVAWDEALALVGEAIGDAAEASSWIVGDRSSLEASWALGHTARTLGSTRLYRRGPAHPAVPLAPLLGAPAATCTLADCIGTDVLLLVGLDPEAAPALARVVAAAKDRGTRVVVVAPELAPALEAAWLPGRPVSAVFGTRLVDDFLPVAPEGMPALFEAVLEGLITERTVAASFVAAHTVGFDDLPRAELREIVIRTGLARGQVEWLTELLGRARNIVSIWADATVSIPLARVHLARGALGRPLNGLLPFLPGPGTEGARVAGFADEPPVTDGVLVALDADLSGLDGLSDAKVRVHAATHLDPSMLVEAREAVVVLPTQSLYEQRGGGTLASLDRRLRFSPELPDHPLVGEARPAWEIPGQLLRAARPDADVPFRTTSAIRKAIEAAEPLWAGLGGFQAEGDTLQWGGTQLAAGGRFPFPDGCARFQG